MKTPHEWLFPDSTQAARDAQRAMAKEVILEDAFGSINLIGGVDVSNNLYDPAQMIYAAVVVLSFPTFEKIDQASLAEKQTFPYIPGLLGFRESPALVKTFQKLEQKPDLLFVDGHGISHPRGLGIASQLGLLLDIPTIGVAKSILVGSPAEELGSAPGSQVPLLWKGKQIGMLVRTKVRSNPLIISTGHRVSLPTALELVQNCLRGYRLPEPTRQAHLAANACRKEHLVPVS